MSTKIPKIIHYCWFGGNQETELMKQCLESWKKYLPESEFEYKLWNEESFDITSNKFVEEAYKKKKWAFITDYVRLWCLYKYGGIYLDTDVEIIKPLDKFLNDSAFSGFEDEQYIPTGIMGAIKNNEWIEELLKYYDNKDFDMTPNTKIITEISLDKFNLQLNNKEQLLIKGNVKIYPKDVFCPKNHYDGKIRLTENTCAIHHFQGSWRTRKDKLKQLIHIFIIKILGPDRHQKILKKIKGIS